MSVLLGCYIELPERADGGVGIHEEVSPRQLLSVVVALCGSWTLTHGAKGYDSSSIHSIIQPFAGWDHLPKSWIAGR